MIAWTLLLFLQDGPEKSVREALPVLEKGAVSEAYAAVERLSYLGPSAFPALRKAAADAPEHVRRMLALTCDEIEAETALKDLYGRPARFSISGKNQSVIPFKVP